MYLTNLHLRHFRNYTRLDTSFSPGLNVVYGHNAQGKTNLLEAIYFIATARSHRTSRDAELLERDQTQALVAAQVQRRTGDLHLELRYGVDARKSLKINGLPEKKVVKLVGKLAVVLFSPDDLQLVKGAPSLRRRFLDIELCQISERYLYHLQQYQRVLTQRNALLRGGPVSPGLLAAWNEPLLEHGGELIARRLAAVQALGQFADEYHHLLSAQQEHLSLEYRSEIPLADGSVEAIREGMQQELVRRSREEQARRVTVVGPHRDDLQIQIGASDAKLYGSQGQQRTAVLAMKLAELRYMEASIGESPVLLLDDVASELDPVRRHYLLQAVNQGIQTFVSCTDLEDLMIQQWPEQHQLMNVKSGTVSMQSREG